MSASKEVVQEVKGGKQELIWVEQLDRYFEQQTDQAYLCNDAQKAVKSHSVKGTSDRHLVPPAPDWLSVDWLFPNGLKNTYEKTLFATGPKNS